MLIPTIMLKFADLVDDLILNTRSVIYLGVRGTSKINLQQMLDPRNNERILLYRGRSPKVHIPDVIIKNNAKYILLISRYNRCEISNLFKRNP